MKTAFLFPGENSQYIGMARSLTETYPKFLSYFYDMSQILGYDLRLACYCGDETYLHRASVMMPAILITDVIAYEVAKSKGMAFTAVAGYGVGEYAAMVASGMINLETAMKLVIERAKALEYCEKMKPGSMAVITGRTAEEVEKACEEIDEFVIPAIYNAPDNTVVSGTDSAVDKIVHKFNSEGAHCTRTSLSCAYHTKLMQVAAERFLEQIRFFKFNPPNCRYFAGDTGDELKDFDNMPEYLAKQLTSQVNFVRELEIMAEQGYDTFIECGPMDILSKFTQKTLPEALVLNVEDMESLKKSMSALGIPD